MSEDHFSTEQEEAKTGDDDLIPAAAPEQFVGDVVRRQDSLFRPVLGAVVFGIGYLGLLLAGGELRRFASAGLEVLPFALLVVLAYLGEEREWARVLTIVYWSIIALGIGLVVLTTR